MKFYIKQNNLHCAKIAVPCRGQAPGPHWCAGKTGLFVGSVVLDAPQKWQLGFCNSAIWFRRKKGLFVGVGAHDDP
jgi:hypothetical protein